MTVYTVHEPPPRKGRPDVDPDRFVFVRDGFYLWAFVFGPLWMLWRRLWLVFVLFVIVMVALQFGLSALGVSHAVKLIVTLLVHLLIGFEAATLWRWTLSRRRWVNLGTVVAPDVESAERRFFDLWVADHTSTAPAPATTSDMPPPSLRAPAATAPGIIGLFPEPQPRQ